VSKLKNIELSRIFEQIARILKIKGENPFKIRGDLHLHTKWSDGVHTIRQIAEATRSLRESMKDTKNFILSSGCDIPISTPLENIEAFMKAARE
jgi:DNA polymerase/3'-5' exonuclease PolX